ncbi:MAG: ribosome silencing factor [Planctomycetota bacterium]
MGRSPNHYGDFPIEPRDFALNLADMIARQQGQDLVILDVSGPLAIADFFVIATARNPRHAHALAREVLMTAKAEGQRHNKVSGLEDEGGWVLVDLDWIVVHLFLADKRAFYDLESLWSDAPRIPFTPSDPAPRSAEPSLDPLRGTV